MGDSDGASGGARSSGTAEAVLDDEARSWTMSGYARPLTVRARIVSCRNALLSSKFVVGECDQARRGVFSKLL